jgi:hypothetical protein
MYIKKYKEKNIINIIKKMLNNNEVQVPYLLNMYLENNEEEAQIIIENNEEEPLIIIENNEEEDPQRIIENNELEGLRIIENNELEEDNEVGVPIEEEEIGDPNGNCIIKEINEDPKECNKCERNIEGEPVIVYY